MVVAIAASLLFLAAATLALNEYTGWWQLAGKKNNTVDSINAVVNMRNAILTSLNPPSLTVAGEKVVSGSPLNPGLSACLSSGTCPTGWSPLYVTDRQGRQLTFMQSNIGFNPYKTPDATEGIATFCSEFSETGAALSCPLRYDLQWAWNSTTDEILISGLLRTNTVSLVKGSANYNIQVRVPATAFAPVPTDPCDAGYPTPSPPFASGDGVTDPYTICTAAQFNAIGSNSTYWNKRFKLLRDIDLTGFTISTFNRIGDFSTAFTGQLDGNNKVLSNLNLSSSGFEDIGIFNSLGSGSSVRDLTITNFAFSGGSGAIGLLAGAATGSTIQNVTVNGSITGSNLFACGGLAGAVSGTSVTNVVSQVTFPVGTRSGIVGGVIGQAELSSVLSNVRFTGTGNFTTVQYALGGLVGRLFSNSTLSQSLNSGSMTVVTHVVDAGGIVGVINNNARISETVFSGSLRVRGASGTTGTGGFVGLMQGGAHVLNSSVTGSIQIDAGGPPVSQWIGGQVGRLAGSGTSTITNTYSAGTIVGPTVTPHAVLGTYSVGAATFSNVFYDSSVNTYPLAPVSSGVTGLPTSAMQDPTTFSTAGWSSAVWRLSAPAGSYLKLQWEP